MNFFKQDLLPKIAFKTSRSGGKGGQHVNKVSSKAELNFDFQSSDQFNESQKARIAERFKNRLTADGQIQIISDEERSQFLNKERALEKLYLLLTNALLVRKARKATKPKKSAVEQRLKDKQKRALKKVSRKGGWIE